MTPPEATSAEVLREVGAGRLVAVAAAALRYAAIPSPRLDAELLVAHLRERLVGERAVVPEGAGEVGEVGFTHGCP